MCTHATHASATTEGFTLRLLESDISMALCGVSMAIPCTEMKRGRPRLRPRNRDKFTSQPGRLKSLPLVVSFLLQYNSLCISTHTHLLTNTHFHHQHSELLPHITLTLVSHTVFFLSVELFCSLFSINPKAFLLRCFSFSVFPRLPFFPSHQEESKLFPPRLTLIHPTSLFFSSPNKKKNHFHLSDPKERTENTKQLSFFTQY